MKDLSKIIGMIFVIAVVFVFKDNIANFITDKIIYMGSNRVLTYNEHYLNYDYEYVQNIDKSKVDNYQETLNMIYSIINSGDNSFSFYCNYDNCIDSVKALTNNNETISNINNFVHPYNSFSTINVDISNSGKITIKTKKLYNDDEIEYIDNYIQSFIDQNIKEEMTNIDKIKLFHDHIINNTIYDENNNEDSYTAYNLITTGKSICGGYSDIMSIYLFKLGIQNYKVSSKDHIWNLVNLDNVWYHLDVTWDDPVASDGNQYLIHNFFMISTEELLSLDNVEHNFDESVYKEAKRKEIQ